MAVGTDPKPVGGNPPGAPAATRGRAPQYKPALERVKERVLEGDGTDDWWEIAKFTTERGAHNALNRINAGKIELPDGEFEFRAWKLDQVTSEGTASRLLARFIQEGE